MTKEERRIVIASESRVICSASVDIFFQTTGKKKSDGENNLVLVFLNRAVGKNEAATMLLGL